jgi:predicted DNA binding CopG/RHH family protein
MKKLLKLPTFKTEAEERVFWAKINLADYYEPSDAERISFPNLKPTTKPISLRLPEYVIRRIKEQANAQGVPYQTLMKMKLSELA